MDTKGNRRRADRVCVLVDGPHRLLDAALKALIAGLPGLGLIDVDQGPGAASPRPELQPDLVLFTCLEQPADPRTLAELRGRYPDAAVLYLVLAWTPRQTRAALQLGAIGCLSADVTPDELARALHQAARGEITLSPDLARDLIGHLARPHQPPATPRLALTVREQEVLVLVVGGMNNKEVASRLNLSLRTVENHLASVFGKLGVRTRTEAAVLAVQQGWAPEPP